MGKVVQVRVWAQTYDPMEMRDEWPTLVRLAWPEKQDGPGAHDNVQGLVRAFADRRMFGEWDPGLKAATKPGAEEALACLEELEAALGDWNPSLANRLTDRLEEILDSLEKVACDSFQSCSR